MINEEGYPRQCTLNIKCAEMENEVLFKYNTTRIPVIFMEFHQRRWKYYFNKPSRIPSGFALISKVTLFCIQAHFLSL